jgi:V/A-type H+-transporting ATPase subunit I
VLKKLYELGVVHIIEKNKIEVEKYKKNKLNLQLYEKNLKKIATKREISAQLYPEINPDIDVIAYIQDNEEKISELEKQKNFLLKDIEFYNIWENFDLNNIKKLNQIGIEIKFFSVDIKKFDQKWTENYTIEIINKNDTKYFFICIKNKEEHVNINAKELFLPDKSLAELNSQLEKINSEIELLNNNINKHIANALALINTQLDQKNQELDFSYANANVEKLTDDKVILLEGWVPEELSKKLNEYLDNEDIVYIAEKPEKSNDAPVLLKNNKFAKLFEPIGELFSLPAYTEIDLTPFFAPFFMLFFGFCVGDTGYGLIILILTIILRSKVNKKLKPILTLATILGASTVIMGLVTGTFFGVNLVDIKSYPLKSIILEPLSLFWASIGIGGVQILFGMIIKAANLIKQKGLKYGLSTIGWILLLLTIIIFVGLEQFGVNVDNLKLIKNILQGASLLLILLFANPEKNFLISSLSGIYDAYNMITGIFGDLLSYVRLFALGMSGGILGLVFNQIASQFLSIGVIGWILFTLVLILGHGMNIFLACLGGFVHPMRLTFVEFYKNSGFAGGGKKYKPFAKNN